MMRSFYPPPSLHHCFEKRISGHTWESEPHKRPTDCANPNPCFYYCLPLCMGKTVCSTALSSAYMYEVAFYSGGRGVASP